MKFTGERFIPTMENQQLEIEHMQRYESIKKIVEGKTVLDAACGEGYGTNMLSLHAKEIVGIDIDHETIDHAKKKYSSSNVQFFQASIEKLPFEDGYFDVVVSFETLEHVSEKIQRSFMDEIKRVLKPNGILIISTPERSIYSDFHNYKNEFHVKEYDKDEFCRLLKEFFADVNLFFQGFEIASIICNEYVKQLSNLQYKDNRYSIGKYMIAICSPIFPVSQEILENIATVIVDTENKYEYTMKRVVDLHNGGIERDKHIEYLNKQIEQQQGQIKQQQEQIGRQQEQIEQQQEQIEQQKQKSHQLVEKVSFLETRNQQNKHVIESMQQEVNKVHELENSIIEYERTLNHIYSSDGWKLLTKYYGLRDKMFPKESKRNIITKNILNKIKKDKYK